MTCSWIGLGANLGDPQSMFSSALRRLHSTDEVRVVTVSSAWHTPAWGVDDQPDFLNAVACLETNLNAADLLKRLLEVEDRLGRQRDGSHWGPRTIDLDLLIHGEVVITEPDLIVPHPRMAERAFVLVPLHSVAPDLEVPGVGRVDELLAALDDSEVCAVRAAGPLTFQPD